MFGYVQTSAAFLFENNVYMLCLEEWKRICETIKIETKMIFINMA